MLEYSLIGIKPDAFTPNAPREVGSELKKPLPENPEDFIEAFRSRLQNLCLTILAEKQGMIDKETASAHYNEHLGVFDVNYNQDKHEFLIGYMMSGPCYFAVVHGEDAIKKWREALVSIREEYLVDRKKARYNMTHASDNPDGAREEILLHFPDFSF